MAGNEVREIIGTLNGIKVGEFAKVDAMLQRVRDRLAEIEQADLSGAVREAREKLKQGDIPGFRKLIAKVVSRLGHVK